MRTIPSLADSPRCQTKAFTLSELLVVTAIIAMLASILMPSLAQVRSQAQSMVCMSNLRSIAFDFNLISNNPPSIKKNVLPDQNDETVFGLTSFIDKLYFAGAYYPDHRPSHQYSYANNVFFCPSASPNLVVERGEDPLPWRTLDGAIPDPNQVSYAFNARLHHLFRSYNNPPGFQIQFPRLGLATIANWVDGPQMALMTDVNPQSAPKTGGLPHWIAPPIEPFLLSEYVPTSSFPLGRRWHPAYRHGNRANIALLDGSVQSEDNLLSNPNRWADAVYNGYWDVNGNYQGSGDLISVKINEDSLDSIEVH